MAATAVAASTQPVKKPDHVFVVPAARNAVQATDRAITDLTTQFEQLAAKTTEINAANNDPDKIGKVVEFYDAINQTWSVYKATIQPLNDAMSRCRSEGEVLTSGRTKQFELLRMTQTVKDRGAAAQKDKAELASRVEAEKARKLGDSYTRFEGALVTALQKYPGFMDRYSTAYQYSASLGFGITSVYSPADMVSEYKKLRTEQKKSAATATAAKPAEAQKAPAVDGKAAEKPAAAAVAQTEPNWNHRFLIDITPIETKIHGDWSKQSIEAQGKIAAKLPALEAAEKTAKLQGKEAIASEVTLWKERELQNRTANNVIENMKRIVEACDQALAPLSETRADVLKDLDLMTDFTAAVAQVKADKEELQRRIQKLSELQKTVNQPVLDFGNAVGKKCLDFLYKEGKVWYYVTSYTSAIDLFKEQYMTEQKPVAATVAASTTAAATAAQPPVATASQPATAVKAQEPTKTEAPKATAAPMQWKIPEPKPAPKIKFLNFDPAAESPVLKNHLRRLEGQHQQLNFSILDSKPVSPAQQTEYVKVANEVGTYLMEHNPEQLQSPLQVPQTYSEHWRQANSLVEGVNAMIADLQNTDSKHSVSKK